LLWALAAAAAPHQAIAQDKDITEADPEAAKTAESHWIDNTRQVTFGGLRAGEGYFSRDGQEMVFQSERDPANPFYQIFLMDMASGDISRVSPGNGKTTCAWIHPQGGRVLFASTHGDPASPELQKKELDFRASGQQRRYAWDYDPQFELYEYDRPTKKYRRLTDALGYDAEASYSPDGKTVLFASNRAAFGRELSDREKTLFEIDPASMIDIYKMNADGTNVLRLTDTLGYDGGPFQRRWCDGRSLHHVDRRRRAETIDGTRGDELGPLFSPQRRIPDLHDEPARLRELRTLCRPRRRPRGTGSGHPHRRL
jgi:dipeptidyl aminopeptidase/acylaminoacyl peptidase